MVIDSPHTPMTRALRFPLVVLVLLATGCSVDGRVEDEIEAALPAVLGPADDYRVTVDNVRLGAGTADRIQIEGRRVARENAPVIERLSVDLRGVRYDRGTKRLTGAESARATLRLVPADLAAYLDRQRGMSRARLTLRPPDGVTLRTQGEFEGFRLPVDAEVRGRLVARDGTVSLDVERVSAAGFGLGGALARRLDERINPVLDLTDEDLALRVTAVRIQPDTLVLDATGDLAGLRLPRRQ